MARPKIEDDFTLFEAWLRKDCGLSPSSARTIASRCRNVDKEDKLAVTERADQYFASLYSTNRKVYYSLTAALRMYQKYSLTVKRRNSYVVGDHVPGLAAKRAGELPIVCRQAVRQLMAQGFTLSNLHAYDWSAVNLSEMLHAEQCHVRDLKNPTEFWIFPSAPLRVLYEWAEPGVNLATPLLPDKPGSELPYPLAALNYQVKQLTPEELAERLKPPEASDARITSASAVEAAAVEEDDDFAEESESEPKFEPDAIATLLTTFDPDEAARVMRKKPR